MRIRTNSWVSNDSSQIVLFILQTRTLIRVWSVYSDTFSIYLGNILFKVFFSKKENQNIFRNYKKLSVGKSYLLFLKIYPPHISLISK